MSLSRFVPFVLAVILLNLEHLSAQIHTQEQILKQASVTKAAEEEITFKKILQLSKERGWKMMTTGKNGQIVHLVGIDPLGYPLYVSTDNNIISAATIKTNLLWPGGSTGLALTGSSANIKGKIGIWDGGKIRNTHVELVNRVTQKDNATTLSDHATHVAGTLIASGVNPVAKGMSYGAQQLVAYDFDHDVSEMLAEAPNLLISNHSYETVAGWHFNDTEKRWEFYGPVNSTEDFKLGQYSDQAQVWDSIAYNAPYYLIVKAAGNKRNENGPAVGQPYWRMDANGQWVNAGNRPANISSNDGYDIIPGDGTGKNILTIGAINQIPGGFSASSDAQITNFSSWGPTDDGRIKPDVVANGINVLSSTSTGDNDYAIYSGTSMATPSAAGSAFLLQEYYSRIHGGTFMRSATLKGIIIHTADDAGNVGPDYQYGWGVINMEKAAAVITSNNTNQLIFENNLLSGASYSLPVIASGKGPLTVTVCWTDPKGTVETTNLLNNPAKKLVNDLDVRVRRSTGTTYLPWVLAPANPSAPATTGDNTIDNVEKIVIDDAVPGETYTIQVTHKGVLSRGQQAYSLIVSGAGGQAYCSSAPTSSAGARIDKVSIGSFTLNNATGCTTYTNNTNSTIPVEVGQNVPVSINVSSCDASSANKIVKVFIDFNNDGDFLDAGETVSQSGIIAATGVFNGSFTCPATLTVGSYAVMRIIVQQTATASDVNPCGSYGNGETQDYRIKITSPSNDAGITEIVSPSQGSCSNGSQLVSIRIKNFGANTQLNVPVTAVIQSGATTVATLTAVCADTIHAYSDVVYTFQTPFNALAGNTYTITASTNLAADQNSLNNSGTSSVVINSASSAPTGTAEICGTSQVFLKATTSAANVPVWYTTATSTTPIAAGNNTSSTTVTANKVYYLSLNEVSGKLGPANKTAYTSGGYNSYSGNFLKFTNSVPLTIESARLFIGNPGKITFIVADISNFNAGTGSFSYTTISSTTIDVYATRPIPQPGQVNENNAADLGAVFYLNLPVPTPGNHAIIVQCQNGATIYRNSGISANPYPFSIPNIISITGNSATNTADTTNVNFYQQFYYFLYDIGVKLAGCASARVAVTATNAVAPVITQAGNVLTSSTAAGNQWYLNGNPVTGATGQAYTATSSGVYKSVLGNSGCALSSNEINVSVTGIVDLNGTGIALIASPNPNKGQFFLQFELKGKDDLIISLINTIGQEVYKNRLPAFTGKFSQQINTGQTSSGMYVLKIQHNKKIYIKKILIE